MAFDPRVVVPAAIYAVWVVLTLLHATDRYRRPIRARDAFNLVPEWRFFGTNPGRTDYHLLYRDRLAPDGELTRWVEIPLIVPRPWHSFIYNPSRRAAKAIMDVVISLCNDLQTHGDRIGGSLPYLTILQHVSTQPAVARAVRRQFLVLHSSADTDDAEPELIFCSEEHELDGTVRC